VENSQQVSPTRRKTLASRLAFNGYLFTDFRAQKSPRYAGINWDKKEKSQYQHSLRAAPYSVPGRLIVMDVAIAKREHVMYVRHAKLCIARAIEHKFSTSRSFTILLPVSP